MSTKLQGLLLKIRYVAADEVRKGRMFEELVVAYLRNDPQYKDLLDGVWQWNEWPHRRGADTGIDIVARERLTGDYWAIQCKFFDPNHTIQKADIDSFLAESGQKFSTLEDSYHYTQRYIVSTTDNWNSNAERTINDQIIPVKRIGLQDLEESSVDWDTFIFGHHRVEQREKKILRVHQTEAIDAVVKGFERHDRGKMIMACGTGKTLTSLRLAEKIVPAGGKVLLLTPSISLVAQTLREWTAEAHDPLHTFVVCSDSKVGREAEDMRVQDLAHPATTDADKLTVAVKKATGTGRRIVVFSTYQSIDVVSKAQENDIGDFDLIICDEAHRTTGLTLRGEDPSHFVKIHKNENIGAKKRLYMTATPRIFAESSKSKAGEQNAVLYSMDDEDTFGPELYRLSFDKATKQGLLTEYKVLIVAVEQDMMSNVVNMYNRLYKFDDKKAIDITFATKILGSWKGLSKRGLQLVDETGQQEIIQDDEEPMRRAVAFSRSISASNQITKVFRGLVDMYNQGGDDIGYSTNTPLMVNCDLEHVDGTMNAMVRARHLRWLKKDSREGECRILSNARCLSEGVDVPALDSVIFFDTRDSMVDIVQSVGRVMRISPGKKFGYIILPVCIPAKDVPDYNRYIETNSQFKSIWKVLKALRSHDESLVDHAEFRRKIRVIVDPPAERKAGDGPLQLDLLPLPLEAITNAVYAVIPKKLGDRPYWSKWAENIARIAGDLISRIKNLIATSPEMALEFNGFVQELQDTLNPVVTEDEAIEMLAQHILTVPIFGALFTDKNFPGGNAVGKGMQRMANRLDEVSADSEVEGLEQFYSQVRERANVARSPESKQELIRNLYDTFFHKAFPSMADRLGIVYTPIPVVDFVLNSADAALRKHFNSRLAEPGIQILDPFAGTGTFLVRLIQSRLIDAKALPEKYAKELHANEIVLLAYYIATINIETAFHARTDEHLPFLGMTLVDTFYSSPERGMMEQMTLAENSERTKHQMRQSIRVILGNPPYSAHKKIPYETVDEKISESYVKRSVAQNRNSLYDSYIRSLRWASDRIEKRGVIAFVTNGSFLDGNNMDGLRKCLAEEYSHLYLINLRGNQRTAGEISRREGGKVFGGGSRVPVVITIMVKDPEQQGSCKLHYHDIGDYLSRQEKLDRIDELGDINGIDWQVITPNAEGDWLNQRNPEFEHFIPLGGKNKTMEEKVIFRIFSQNVRTNRDAWAYNADKQTLGSNMERLIDNYNLAMQKFTDAGIGKIRKDATNEKYFENFNSRNIKWTTSLWSSAMSGEAIHYDKEKIRTALYRPFSKGYLYYHRRLNERVYRIPRIFPTQEHENVVICVTGRGATKPFSALVGNVTLDYEVISKGQCFPMYLYEYMDVATKSVSALVPSNAASIPDSQGYIRREAITEWALDEFRTHYHDTGITKKDIFWYIYGILHASEYRQRFDGSLKRMLPRIPLARDFRMFSEAGRSLGELHLNYENVEPYPLVEETRLVMEEKDYRVHKMKFGRSRDGKDNSVIRYNDELILRDIPLEAYDYVVNGKSAIEWIMERYAVRKDKDSGIVNDPNQYSDNPRYIIDLLKRIVTVSVETMKIVSNLPPLNESKA